MCFKKVVVLFIITVFSISACKQAKMLTKKYTSSDSKKQELDTKTIIKGLKEALRVGAKKTVSTTSRQNGFYQNPSIKISFPPKVKKVEKRLRQIGLGKKVDEFIVSMNRAAEKASKKALNIFIQAVQNLSIQKAREILQSIKNDAATQYFEKNTRSQLYRAFMPVIRKVLRETGVQQVFSFLVKKYNSIPFISKVRFKLDDYVNNKTLDGIFKILRTEEAKIRKNPAARVTAILKKVFASIR